MNEIVNEALKGIVGLAVAILTPMAAKAIYRWRQKHEKDFLGQSVKSAVLWAEQVVEKEGVKWNSADQFEAVKNRIRQELPWLPYEAVEMAIKAAVKEMNDNRDRA